MLSLSRKENELVKAYVAVKFDLSKMVLFEPVELTSCFDCRLTVENAFRCLVIFKTERRHFLFKEN